jgi:hypothetical protein
LIARGKDRQEISHTHEDQRKIDTSDVSRRCDAARRKLPTDRKLAYASTRAERPYLANIADVTTISAENRNIASLTPFSRNKTRGVLTVQ